MASKSNTYIEAVLKQAGLDNYTAKYIVDFNNYQIIHEIKHDIILNVLELIKKNKMSLQIKRIYKQWVVVFYDYLYFGELYGYTVQFLQELLIAAKNEANMQLEGIELTFQITVIDHSEKYIIDHSVGMWYTIGEWNQFATLKIQHLK